MKKIFSVTIMSGVMTLIKMMMGFVIAKVVAVYTGPGGMALLGQVQSIITGINGIVNAPAGNAIVRYTAENSPEIEKCSPWWRASIFYITIICIIIIPIGFASAGYLSQLILQDKTLYWVIWLILLSMPATALGSLIISVLNGLQSYRRYLITGVISAIISGGVLIGMIVCWGVKGALITASVQYGLIGIISLLINIHQPWMKLKHWFGTSGNQNKIDIAHYIIMAVVSSIALPVGLIFVRNFIITYEGWNPAGQWQAVWKISEVYLSVITMALSVYYLPKLATLNDSKLIRNEINRTVLIVIPFCVAMAFGVYICRDFVISLLFTSEFHDARNLFSIQLIGDVVKVVSWLYAYPMIAKRSTKWFVSTEIFFTFTWVLLSFYLIKLKGIHGANLAYLINYTLYLTFVFFNLKNILKNN